MPFAPPTIEYQRRVVYVFLDMVPSKGLEPLTCGLEIRRSILLSYEGRTVMEAATYSALYFVDRTRIELVSPPCKGGVLPIELTAR